MQVYRLCRAPFKGLDGEGARIYGGRWNSPGRSVVYTSGSRALAALEYLVHVDPAEAPDDLMLLTIELADDLTRADVDPKMLPKGWARTIASTECQAIGDEWLLASDAALLFVPAAPVPEERNVLINRRVADPIHMSVVGDRHFEFDPRLVA